MINMHGDSSGSKPSSGEQHSHGNHLLLGGILVTVNGVVLDIGYPAWMSERLAKNRRKRCVSA